MADSKQFFEHCSFRKIKLDSLSKLTRDDVYMLNHPVRDRLLSTEPHHLDAAQERDSEVLLERLRNLAPPVADQFQSRPRGFTHLVFRLVNERRPAESE